MKKILGFYVTRQLPEAPKPKHTTGITAAEWSTIHDGINGEYDAAKARQKNPDNGPSQYMRGLDFALAIVEANMPHTMEV